MIREEKAAPGQRYLSIGEEKRANLDLVNWRTAPRNFKLYRGCSHIVLKYANNVSRLDTVSEHAYLNQQEQEDPVPTCEQIGQMLSDIYGFTRQSRVTADAMRTASGYAAKTEPTKFFLSFLRRPVPAGGGLFPCEVYLLVGQKQSLPAGVYHYDAVHHALDILRMGDYSSLLQSCLAQQEGDTPALVLMLSCFFWKNAYKYMDFSYRLQSLDIGVVVAQSLLIASCKGWKPMVHYIFLDQLANQLLGLDDAYESTYAIISLSTRTTASQTEASLSPLVALEHLSKQIEPVAELSMSLAQWPLLEELHLASLITTSAVLTIERCLPPIEVPLGSTSVAMPPPDPLNLPYSLHQRHSAMLYFKRGEIMQHQVSAFLTEGTRGYSNDLDGQPVVLQHTLLYCVVNAVVGMQPGIYVYHPVMQTLELLQAGDMRTALQGTLTWLSHNMWNVSLCIFPVADYGQGFTVYGDRWYRIQNMEAGLLIQRFYLVAAALTLGCQVNLGYHTQHVQNLLHLPTGYRCLAQILIAPEAHAGQYYEQVLW
jgi:SagB-type dehydrogenase family enzyme